MHAELRVTTHLDMPPDQSRWTQDSKDAHLAASAARFYNYATTDIHTCITLPAALDETLTGIAARLRGEG